MWEGGLRLFLAPVWVKFGGRGAGPRAECAKVARSLLKKSLLAQAHSPAV